MNIKLLASIAVFVLLTGMIGASVLDSAYAAETPKKDAAKEKMAAKKDATKQKVAAKKDAAKEKMAAKKDATKQKVAAKKDAAKEKMAAKKDATKEKVAAKKESASATGTQSVTVEMAKGTSSNTDCGDQCYIPNNVKVTAGGTVVWKNVDSAAHTATDTNGSFDSSLVNAGKSFKHKFDTAGTFEYLCVVHPWMKGTVTVN